MTTNKLTGGQMVVDMLIREGVEKVFAIPGHGNTALLDAFVDRADEIELRSRDARAGGRAHGGRLLSRVRQGRRGLHVDRARRHQHPDRVGDRVRRLSAAAPAHRGRTHLHGEPRRPSRDRPPTWQQLPADGRAGRQALVAAKPGRVDSHRAGAKPSTRCTRGAAARCLSTSPRTFRPSTANTLPRAALAAPRPARPATRLPSRRLFSCSRRPSAR